MTIIPLQSSNPVIRCKCSGLGVCRRDYHPAMSDHFQLSFVVIFIPTIPSQLGIPAFRYNPGVRVVQTITPLRLTFSTFVYGHFYSYHPATIDRPRLLL